MEESLTNNSDAREQPLLSIVMPVFREGASLSAFVADVRSALKQSNRPYELVLVDDGSPDDTWKVITTEAKGCQALRGLRLSRNFGKEAALCAGLEYAQGDGDRDRCRWTASSLAHSRNGAHVAGLWG